MAQAAYTALLLLLVCTLVARAELCSNSEFSSDAACEAAGNNRTIYAGGENTVCNGAGEDDDSPADQGGGGKMCTDADCCHFLHCPMLATGTYFEMYHDWFSCTSTTFVTTQHGNAQIRLDLLHSMGWQGRTWNIRAPERHGEKQGQVVSSSRDEMFTMLQHVTVYDCNREVLAQFEMPFTFTNTLYYLYDKDSYVVARVDMAYFEISNFYLKPCINDPPVQDKNLCQVAPEDVDNRVIKMHKNVFSMSEKWTVTTLRTDPKHQGKLYTDPRVLAEMVVRQSKDGVSWCVLGIVFLVMLGIAWFVCAFCVIRNHFENRARRQGFQRVNGDDAPGAAELGPAAPAQNDGQRRVDEFVERTGGTRQDAHRFLGQNGYDVEAAANDYNNGVGAPPWAADNA